MRRTLLIVRALFYAACFVLLWWWGGMKIIDLDPNRGFRLPEWLVPAGFLLTAAGGFLAVICLFMFVRYGRGTPAPFDPPRIFVSRGPYRFVRNPMYIGGLAVILGIGLILRSVSIAALSLVFLVVVHLFVVLYEEPSLERRFGNSYIEYRKTVRRWLPVFRPFA